jgi:hypothetical protein
MKNLYRDLYQPCIAHEESVPRRVIRALMSSLVQFDGTTRHDQVGTLISRVFAGHDATHDGGEIRNAEDCLGRYGIRVIRASDLQDKTGRPVPRLGDGGGVWLMPAVVKALFQRGPYDGDIWRTELLRLPTAAGPSKSAVRVGGVGGKPIWIGRADIDPGAPVGEREKPPTGQPEPAGEREKPPTGQAETAGENLLLRCRQNPRWASDEIARLRAALSGIRSITVETHTDCPARTRPYTALSQIDQIARKGQS